MQVKLPPASTLYTDTNKHTHTKFHKYMLDILSGIYRMVRLVAWNGRDDARCSFVETDGIHFRVRVCEFKMHVLQPDMVCVCV